LGGPIYRLPEHRRTEIRRVLDRDGYVRVADLALRFDVSPDTVRRDLYRMERHGALHRVRGGAVSAGSSDVLVTDVGRPASAVQATIARHAASLVGPGSAIAIAAGVFAVPLARHVSGVAGLTVVTNSLPASAVLARAGQVGQVGQSVLVTGGTRTRSGALAGRWLRSRCARSTWIWRSSPRTG
jgi:DeoR/GlpR family transcriptional regulator of sugar metabolism